MAAQIGERFNSRSRSGNVTTYRYYVVGTDDVDEVTNLVLTTAPERIGQMPRGEIDAQPLGGTLWHCDVPYSPANADPSEEIGADPGPQPDTGGTVTDGGGNPTGMSGSEPLETGISFNTGTATTRIYRAVAHLADYAPAGSVAPNFLGLINVTGTGKNQVVEGVEVKSPVGSFTFKKQVKRLTVGYFQRIFASTAKVNKHSWKGFAIRELLFEGVDGGYQGGTSDRWDLAYHFSYSPSGKVPDLPVDWPAIYKRGWDYLWFRYATVEDTDADPPVTVQRPVSAHMERVYHEEEFDVFQL